MGKIIGIPPSEYNYEFMIVKPLPDGNFMWIANYENYPYDREKDKDTIITHNLRISHKEKKKEN